METDTLKKSTKKTTQMRGFEIKLQNYYIAFGLAPFGL